MNVNQIRAGKSPPKAVNASLDVWCPEWLFVVLDCTADIMLILTFLLLLPRLHSTFVKLHNSTKLMSKP